MSSSTEINARLDAVEESAKGSLQKSYYGIADDQTEFLLAKQYVLSFGQQVVSASVTRLI